MSCVEVSFIVVNEDAINIVLKQIYEISWVALLLSLPALTSIWSLISWCVISKIFQANKCFYSIDYLQVSRLSDKLRYHQQSLECSRHYVVQVSQIFLLYKWFRMCYSSEAGLGKQCCITKHYLLWSTQKPHPNMLNLWYIIWNFSFWHRKVFNLYIIIIQYTASKIVNTI
jgi:hypothetical protein